MSKLWWAISFQILGGVFAWIQLQGHYAWPSVKLMKHPIIIMSLSLVIAPLYWYSTKWSFEHFGAFWNMRLAGFGIGTIIFGFFTWFFIGEIPTLKTMISVLLATAIILIQVTNI
tara:strand:- start:45 stop:389 length:345 start_codon:yes stop_codon:yes gene_type:complete